MYKFKELTSIDDVKKIVGKRKQVAICIAFDKKYNITDDIDMIKDCIKILGTELLKDEFYIIDGKLFTKFACLPDKTIIKEGGPDHGNYKKGICKNYKYLIIKNSNIKNIEKLYTNERAKLGIRWVGDVICNEFERVYDM